MIQTRPHVLTLANGTTRVVRCTAEFLRVVSATANPFKIGLDGGQLHYFAAGMEVRAPFSEFAVHNDTGGSLTVIVLTGPSSIRDDRLAVSAPITVDTITNPVTVQGSLTAVDTITNPVTVQGSLTAVGTITNAVTVQGSLTTVGAVTSITNPVTTTAAKAATFAGVADATVGTATSAQIVAAGATRRRVHIRLDPDHTSPCRIGGNGTIGAAQGIEMDPGDSMTIETTAAIHAHNPDVTNSAVFSISQEAD